jgi:small subunit ribosomal protein S8
MTMTDPISDLLTRIRNAHLAKHDRLDLPASKLKAELCRVLKESGFVQDFRVIEGVPQGTLRVYLRYDDAGTPAIQHLRRVSKPGRRVYAKAEDLRPVRNGLGVGIVSTSLGVLTDAQARQRRVGGEVLCEIW